LVEREDRGALAQLRRGLGKPPGSCAAMYPYVVPWLRTDCPPWEQDAHYLVASLFASHADHSDHFRSMGETMRRVGAASGDDASTERRFVALLNASGDELPDHLRHAVALAKSKGVSVNYERLCKDIMNWNSDFRNVQKAWAADFWAQKITTTVAEDKSSTAEKVQEAQ